MESEKAFALIDFNDGAIKSVVTQVADKTSDHDRLLQQVDTALRTQVHPPGRAARRTSGVHV